jgi:hypothetical protein
LSIFYLILGVASTDINPGIALIKIPINQEIKRISCDEAFKQHTTWTENPNYKEGNNQVWGYYTHEGKPIYLSYCQDHKGNWVR